MNICQYDYFLPDSLIAQKPSGGKVEIMLERILGAQIDIADDGKRVCRL